ncbi:MAG: type IV pilin protein [Candidatus Polarisedimenticolaceae bacterium]|nr:type IV pilin protein [Candidatus Polarisedimenticolaceae bacterium]
MTVALAQERMRSIATTNATFTTDLTDAGLRLDPQAIISDYYDIAVTAGPGGIATSYLLTLTARGAQLNDENCRTMTISHLNLKTALAADGSTDTTNICW